MRHSFQPAGFGFVRDPRELEARWGALPTRLGFGLAALCIQCVAYEDTIDGARAHAGAAWHGGAAGSGTSGGATSGGATSGGAAGASSGGRASYYPGGGTSAQVGLGGAASAGGSIGNAGGSAADSAGQPAAGGTSAPGGASMGGSSVAGGNSMAGGSSAAGAAGSIADRLLSRGQPVSADSEQASKLHYASDGNDGDTSTRWCAADYKLNHYWEVDLGTSFTLSSVHIVWEKAISYQFKVESSTDHDSWSLALDQTQASSAVAEQRHSLPPGTVGRYVRITVTGGISTTAWASFYEFEVFGH